MNRTLKDRVICVRWYCITELEGTLEVISPTSLIFLMKKGEGKLNPFNQGKYCPLRGIWKCMWSFLVGIVMRE